MRKDGQTELLMITSSMRGKEWWLVIYSVHYDTHAANTCMLELKMWVYVTHVKAMCRAK